MVHVEYKRAMNNDEGVQISWGRLSGSTWMLTVRHSADYRASDLAAMSEVIAAVVKKGPPQARTGEDKCKDCPYLPANRYLTDPDPK